MRDRPSRLTAALAAALVVATGLACTEPAPPDEPPPAPTPEPAPSVTTRTTVVLPALTGPDDPLAAELRRGLDAAGRDRDTQVQVVQADGEAFVADLVGLFAARDRDLICTVGAGSRAVVSEAAERHPGRRFCALGAPAPTDPPATVSVVEVRTEELGHLVGAALAGEQPVGVVLEAGRPGADRFRQGLLAGLGDTPVVYAAVGEDDPVGDAVVEVLAAGVQTVVLDAGSGVPAAAVAAAAQAEVAGPGWLPERGGPPELLLGWQVRWDAVFGPVLDDLLADEPGTSRSLGLEDEVFELTVASGAGSELRERLAQAEAELLAGERDPRG